MACDQKAAVKIQRIWRGHVARIKTEKAKKPLLSYALLEKAKPYIDTPSNLLDLPRASSGKTAVYLPKELPIVLKKSGDWILDINLEYLRKLYFIYSQEANASKWR